MQYFFLTDLLATLPLPLASPPTGLRNNGPTTFQNAALSLIQMPLYNHHVEFFTATILRWQHLLATDLYKQIIIDSLAWLSREDRCIIYGFVIMPNHIHLLWRISNNHGRPEVQGA
ncbi:MAG: hypothetical protein EOO06_20240, partial [Chitinophagaceae bacterium]